MAPVEELSLLEFDRSNKGASKQRRDQINAEIATMRDLLPLPESSRQRLSQLQIMSLSCVYIRKCNVLKKLFRPQPQERQMPDSVDFFQALTGFLLITTREGKLLYISENVTDFLGHSMVDMKTQGDSLYDIVDKRDHGTVQAQLLQGDSHLKDATSDVSFFCRMNMSRTLKRQSGFGDVKVMHVRGHFVLANTSSDPSSDTEKQYVFMASCSPLLTPDLKENLVQNNTMVFKTVHHLDMSYVEVTNIAEHHLGFTSEELHKKSWYSMVHPEDIYEAKDKHQQLIRSNHEMGCTMTLRMLRSDGEIFWVNLVMHMKQPLSQNDQPMIVCINQVINAEEACQIKAHGQMFSLYPSRVQEVWTGHMQHVANSQSLGTAPWIQHNDSTPMPMQGYQGSVSGYLHSIGQPSSYDQPCMPMISPNRCEVKMGISQYNTSPNLVQSDKLKAMLKRKIQGPSPTQSKVAKMSWSSEGCDTEQGYLDLAQPVAIAEKFLSVPESRSVECHGQTMQMVQASNFGMGKYAVKNCSKAFKPRKPMAPTPRVMNIYTEQVVPDVKVPESYLTPDPSPASSPEPASSFIKTEVIDPSETTETQNSTALILQALEKLASLSPEQKLKSSRSQAQISRSHESKNLPSCNRELHIFDAFEIENFFDMLDPSDQEVKIPEQIKAEMKVEKVVPKPIIANSLNVPNFLKEEHPFNSLSTPFYNSRINLSTVETSREYKSPSPIAASVSPISVGQEATQIPCRDSMPFLDRRKGMTSCRMVSSPASVSSQEASGCDSFDDLLSCFSDEGLNLSPLHLEAHTGILDAQQNKGVGSLSSPFQTSLQCTSYMPFVCPRPLEEMSPQSSISSLVGEDEVVDNSATVGLSVKLDSLNSQDQMVEAQYNSIKDRDVLGMGDELNQLDFFFDSMMASQDVLKTQPVGFQD